jgi:hypothetical protein
MIAAVAALGKPQKRGEDPQLMKPLETGARKKNSAGKIESSQILIDLCVFCRAWIAQLLSISCQSTEMGRFSMWLARAPS